MKELIGVILNSLLLIFDILMDSLVTDPDVLDRIRNMQIRIAAQKQINTIY
jgi:hypothetical protein